MGYVFSPSGTALADPPAAVVDFRPITGFANRRLADLGHEVLAAEFGRVGPHRQPVERRRPEFVEVFVAIAAGFRADKRRGMGGVALCLFSFCVRRWHGSAAALDFGRNILDLTTLAACRRGNQRGGCDADHQRTKSHNDPFRKRLCRFATFRRGEDDRLTTIVAPSHEYLGFNDHQQVAPTFRPDAPSLTAAPPHDSGLYVIFRRN